MFIESHARGHAAFGRFAHPTESSLIMSEWLAIERWAECEQMARPGIVFEIQNAEGLSLITQCTATLPPMPFDWKSPPIRFRAIVEPPARHSDPLPPPKD
jgi:hypothetical protein